MATHNQNSQQLSIPQRFRRSFRWYQRVFDDNSACIVLALAAVTAFSAFLGIAFGTPKQTPDADTDVTPPTFLNWATDALYEAAQVIFLNMEAHKNEFNFFIGLARFGAVCLAILVATEGIRRLFKSSFEHLRISFWGNEMVFIAGLGRIGLEVARDRVANNDFVVALEKNDPNHWTTQAEDDGILVKHGDVNHAALLETIVAKNPREVFLVTGDDQTNINALARLRSLRREREQNRPGSVGPGVCYVHIDDAVLYSTLCRTLAEQQQAGISDEGLAVHYFNICHETACELIVKDLTTLRPSAHDEVALYVVFGFEQMGQAMVKELAEFAHFENQRRARILVLTKMPSEDADRCLARWPRMSPRFVHEQLSAVTFETACDEWGNRSVRVLPEYQIEDERAIEHAANVHFCKLGDHGVLSQSDVAAIVSLATAEGVCPVALFCHEDDDVNFKMASEFNDLLSDFHKINRIQDENCQTIPCRVFLPRSRALRNVSIEPREARFLRPFGSVSEGISRAQDTLVEELGMVFAWAYDKHAKKHNDARFDFKKYLPEWRGKPYWDRYSNCAAAEHAWIKMQILDVEPSELTGIDPTKFSREKKALIAYVEHNRWLAERLLMGWSYGERSDNPPRRTSMCTKGELSADELEKDFAQIQAMCEYLIEKGVGVTSRN